MDLREIAGDNGDMIQSKVSERAVAACAETLLGALAG